MSDVGVVCGPISTNQHVMIRVTVRAATAMKGARSGEERKEIKELADIVVAELLSLLLLGIQMSRVCQLCCVVNIGCISELKKWLVRERDEIEEGNSARKRVTEVIVTSVLLLLEERVEDGDVTVVL